MNEGFWLLLVSIAFLTFSYGRIKGTDVQIQTDMMEGLVTRAPLFLKASDLLSSEHIYKGSLFLLAVLLVTPP